MKAKKVSISAFFPVYNDWATIPAMVLLVDSALKRLASEYEIILVDDGSNELTKKMLEELVPKFDKIKLITHHKNRGYGGALKSGIYSAKYDYIFYTDGDAQYNPQEIELLVDKLSDEIDIVNGYKIERNDPLYRKIMGKIYVMITRMMFGFKIRDVDCDFRLMRRRLFDDLKLEFSSGVICVEMISRLTMRGARFAEVPVNHYYRTSGKSQFFNFKRLFKTTINIFQLWRKVRILKKY